MKDNYSELTSLIADLISGTILASYAESTADINWAARDIVHELQKIHPDLTQQLNEATKNLPEGGKIKL